MTGRTARVLFSATLFTLGLSLAQARLRGYEGYMNTPGLQ